VFLATLRRWLPAPTPALEGIDVSGALQRLDIDRAAFDRILLRFADGQRETLTALRSAVVAGNHPVAALHAHAIAGAAGTLGADALRAAAKALEDAGRQGSSDLAQLFAVVEDRAATVFRSIDTLRPAAERAPSASAAFDRTLAGAALARLTAALDDFDLSAANGALADLRNAGLPAWAADDLGELRGYVDAYEYREARDTASRLLARVQAVDA
jgi:HPt (histidine-containing phosphotransfer) domain-containing protein